MASRKLGMIAGALLLSASLGVSAPSPPAPPATQEGGPSVAGDIFKLGDADLAVRAAAEDRLWHSGSAVEPMLREATKSDNPERAERALAILRDIDEGLTPTSSPEVVELLRQYQAGSLADKNNAVVQLGQAGIEGTRILLHLDRIEEDGNVARTIEQILQSSPVAAALLIRERDDARAESLLAGRAEQISDGRDYAAFLLIRGELPKALAALQKNHAPQQDMMLCALEKASGEAPAAARNAVAIGNFGLAERYLKDAADWPALAKLLDAHPPENTADPLALRCMVNQFAGPSAAADSLMKELLAEESARPNDFALSRQPYVLCMLDHPQDALDRLIARSDFGAAVEMLDARMEYSRALALLPQITGQTPESVVGRAEVAVMLQMVGKAKEARVAILADRNIAIANPDSYAWSIVCKSARQLHMDDLANRLVLDALNGTTDEQRQVPALMEGNADSWRQFFAEHDEPLIAIRKAQAIAEGKCPPAQLRLLALEMEAWSQSQAVTDQANLRDAIATTLESAGELDAAAAVRQHRAEMFPSVDAWTALGDDRCKLKDWPSAITAYGKAADLDPSAALPAFLLGYAMEESGDIKSGRDQMDLAHLLALGDVQARLALFDAATDRGLTDDADREQAAIVALADVDDFAMLRILQVQAEQESKAGDFADAAKDMRQLMTAVVEPGAIFTESSAYMLVPSRMHCFLAQADFAAHRPAAALAEAKLTFDDWPGNIDGMITLVRAADSAGDKADADKLFTQTRTYYAQIAAAYPDSSGLHNQVAWFESRCHRSLDDALTQAQRAADLAPLDCAILDTLAETHYQRGEFQAAIDVINRCIDLEPAQPHHRKQLARFRLGLISGVVDMD